MLKVIMIVLCCAISASSWAQQEDQEDILPSKYTIVKAGGYGGNERTGQLMYAGLTPQFPALRVSRVNETATCYMMNETAVVFDDYFDGYDRGRLFSFSCASPDPSHFNLYWNGEFAAIHGGYSPANDILYAADVVTRMFIDWYRIPPVKFDKKFQKIIFELRDYSSWRAYFNGRYVVIGIGGADVYPRTSLSEISFLIGFIFSYQHSPQVHENQDHFWGGKGQALANSFSCMTAMAAEFYVTGKNTWKIITGLKKEDGIYHDFYYGNFLDVTHYMDMPSKNCNGRKPGDSCDIDTLDQLGDARSYDYMSGIFNRAFYLLATSNGWNTRKAYDIFVQANRYHWKYGPDFSIAACDVVTSAKELGYEIDSVKKAFAGVGIDTKSC